MGLSELTLAAKWRTEAEAFYQRGAHDLARVLQSCAEDLVTAPNNADELIRLRVAEKDSGYSYDGLRSLIAKGLLKNHGTAGRILVRRGDLPRKPGRPLH